MLPQDAKAFLIEHEIPDHIAEQVSQHAIDEKIATRHNLLFLVLMIGIPTVFLVLFLTLVTQTRSSCANDLPLNAGVALFVIVFASIATSGWVMTNFQLSRPMRVKAAILVGSFQNKNNAPYAVMIARRLNRRPEAITEAEEYIDEGMRMPLPYFKWPAIFMFTAALLSYLILPATC